jgi:hypothetical protein
MGGGGGVRALPWEEGGGLKFFSEAPVSWVSPRECAVIKTFTDQTVIKHISKKCLFSWDITVPLANLTTSFNLTCRNILTSLAVSFLLCTVPEEFFQVGNKKHLT